MKLSENIFKLRKECGLSQEALAEKVNVSRQTISNWELGETTPNPEQLMLLSKIFDKSIDTIVGNDYEVKESDNNKKIDARLFVILSTVMNLFGLFMALYIWYEEQTESAVLVGLTIMSLGCVMFSIGQVFGKNKKNTIKYFLMANIWILTIIPYSCIFNIINATIENYSVIHSPLLQLGNSDTVYIVEWSLYIFMCAVVEALLIANVLKSKKN